MTLLRSPLLATVFATVILSACGGGGGDSPSAAQQSAVVLAPAPTTAPTTVLGSSSAEASALAQEVKDGLAAASNASASQGVTLPTGIEVGALPTGVVTTINCTDIGGTAGSVSVDAPQATQPAAGLAISYTYNGCAVNGIVFNGTSRTVIDRYVSQTDFAFTSTYINFTVKYPNLTLRTLNGSQSCNLVNSVASCYFSDGTRGWSSTMNYSSTGVVNGTYGVKYGSGVVKVTYTNFGPTSGTAVITGANGSVATITRNSASSFTVSIKTSSTSALTVYTVTI
jgi:hypothetical protein